MQLTLKQGERVEDLGRKGYRIIQNKNGFCFGSDAVLLSSFASVKPGERVLDIGTGTGIIPILMEAKNDCGSYVGLDIQKQSIEMATRSVALNGLEEKIHMECLDVKEAAEFFGAASFQVVTTNPPYMTEHHGITNMEEPKAIARHELKCTLEDILRNASKVLKDHGRFYMVHRPFRLTEIMCKCVKYKLEPKRIRFVHARVDKEPTMVLIECLKGGNSRVTIEPPLILYNDGASSAYTEEVREMYGLEPEK